MDYFEILHDESPYQEEYSPKISEKSEKQDGRGGHFEKKNFDDFDFFGYFFISDHFKQKKFFTLKKNFSRQKTLYWWWQVFNDRVVSVDIPVVDVATAFF